MARHTEGTNHRHGLTDDENKSLAPHSFSSQEIGTESPATKPPDQDFVVEKPKTNVDHARWRVRIASFFKGYRLDVIFCKNLKIRT
jgi:hypothetical protein